LESIRSNGFHASLIQLFGGRRFYCGLASESTYEFFSSLMHVNTDDKGQSSSYVLFFLCSLWAYTSYPIAH